MDGNCEAFTFYVSGVLENQGHAISHLINKKNTHVIRIRLAAISIHVATQKWIKKGESNGNSVKSYEYVNML
jgi:hypothetical protein